MTDAPRETGEPAPRERIGKLALVLIFLLALTLRVGTAIDFANLHPQAARPAIDEESYERWALDIAGGDWIGHEVFFQEPLYPYWLGAVYRVWGIGDEPAARLRRQRTAARHIQALYGSVSAVLIALVGAHLFGRRAGIVAGLAYATYRPLVYFPALFLKPNLVVPLLCVLPLLSAWLRGRAGGPWRWGMLGIAAALGALLRGNLLLLLPAFVLLPLAYALADGRAWRAGIRPALAVLLGIVLVLLPVALRNQAVGGVFALTTSGAGTNLYGGNNAENPYGIATEFAWVRGVPEHEADDWRHEAERRTGRMMDPGEVSSFWIGETVASLRAHPWTHVRILWNKLRLSLGAHEVPDNHDLAWDARYVSALRVPLGGFGVWGLLGLGGMIAFALRRRTGAPSDVRDPRGAWELVGLFALYLATIVMTVTSMRIRLALVPMLLPFSGYAVDLILRRARPLAWAPALAVAALVVYWPVYPSAERAEDLLERDYNLAVDLLQESRLEAAEPLVAELSKARPGTVSVGLLEAELAYRRGVLARSAGAPDATAELDRALKTLRPIATSDDVAPRDRYRARKLAGLVQFEVKKWAAAERSFREALAFDPSDAELRLYLANALWMRAGSASDAEAAGLLAEVRSLLLALQAEQPSPLLDAFLADVRARLGE